MKAARENYCTDAPTFLGEANAEAWSQYVKHKNHYTSYDFSQLSAKLVHFNESDYRAL